MLVNMRDIINKRVHIFWIQEKLGDRLVLLPVKM